MDRSVLEVKALLALVDTPRGLPPGAHRRPCGSRVARRDLAAALDRLTRDGLVERAERRGRT